MCAETADGCGIVHIELKTFLKFVSFLKKDSKKHESKFEFLDFGKSDESLNINFYE
ncbi:MAG: hypothetical protein GX362_06135 [Methanosarcinaceae archaeon]|nr:hypothetical protein [Methanosarcinaceae archaeon]